MQEAIQDELAEEHHQAREAKGKEGLLPDHAITECSTPSVQLHSRKSG